MRISCFLMALLCYATLCADDVRAQNVERRILSVEEMFLLADENNLSINAYSTAVEQSKVTVTAAKNAYLPSVDVSLSFAYNGNGTITDRNFSGAFTAEIPHFGNNFALEVSQVIFAGGAIKNGVKMSELKSDLASLNADGNRCDIRFMLVGNYLELERLQNQLQILKGNMELTANVLDNMRSRFEQGAVLSNDITRYELQYQNLNYSKIQVENAMLIINNQLNMALGLPQSTVVVPDIPGMEKLSVSEDSSSWQNAAETFSPALRGAAIGLAISEHAEKITYAERFPQVAFFAAEHLDGPVTIDIPAINKNFNYWYAGVGVKYNLDNLYKTNKSLKVSKLATKFANEQLLIAREHIQIAMDAAFIQFKEAFFLLETKEKSASLARQNYEMISYRYKNDLALITDLLDASSQKLEAELQVANAKINIIYNYYKMKHISGTL